MLQYRSYQVAGMRVTAGNESGARGRQINEAMCCSCDTAVLTDLRSLIAAIVMILYTWHIKNYATCVIYIYLGIICVHIFVCATFKTRKDIPR